MKNSHDLGKTPISICKFSGKHYDKYHDWMMIYTRQEDICRLLEIEKKTHLSTI